MEYKHQKYLSIALYFIIFNYAILTLTVTLHEMGHISMGWLHGCNGKIIFLDFMQGGNTYTLLECKYFISEKFLAFGAFVYTIPFSIIFLLLKNFPEKRFFYVVTGLTILTASLDIEKILGISSLSFFIDIFSVFPILYGEALMISEKIISARTTVKKI